MLTSLLRVNTPTPLQALVGLAGPATEQGVEILMLGTAGCSASQSFKPYFLDSLALPVQVHKRYVDRSTLGPDLKYYPTPMFVVVVGGTVVDIHAGAVSSKNEFAERANARIFEHLLIRNGLAKGDPWALATNRIFQDWSRLDYQLTSFADLRKEVLKGSSFKRAMFSSVRMDGIDFTDAKFEGTIFAHVDARSAKLTAEQLREILWVNSICPDGSMSAANGGQCPPKPDKLPPTPSDGQSLRE